MIEDQKELIAELRDPWSVTIEELAEMAATAADEIERLAKRVKELEALPSREVDDQWERAKDARSFEGSES